MTTKPPTIRVSASGIEAKPVLMNTAPEPGIDWPALSKLPTFQEFIGSIADRPPDLDAEQFANEYAFKLAAMAGDTELYERYAQWHQAQGRWPNETPNGNLITH